MPFVVFKYVILLFFSFFSIVFFHFPWKFGRAEIAGVAPDVCGCLQLKLIFYRLNAKPMDCGYQA